MKVEVAAKQLRQAVQAGDARIMGDRSVGSMLAGAVASSLTVPFGVTVAGKLTCMTAPEDSSSAVTALRRAHVKFALGLRSGCVQLMASPAMVMLASRTLPVLLAVKVHTRLAAAASQVGQSNGTGFKCQVYSKVW